jgi:hypothetical protein
MDLSKKYRIVETIEGFKIQKRTLFFWSDFSEPRYSYNNFCSGIEYDRDYIIIFDKKGNIVAKNLHGEEMLQKLEELMHEK